MVARAQAVNAATVQYTPAVSAVNAGADSLNDGPHVYWLTSSDAIAFYLCNGSVEAKQYKVNGTLSFNGFCADSATEYVMSARDPKVEPHTYKNVSKMFAISDLEGQYDDVVDLLQAAGVIDRELNWSWGEGHLVVVGDIFDRGRKVTETLWLFHRLEQQARGSKGRVHVLLGNHEMMMFHNDVRYVDSIYTEGIVKTLRISYADLFGPDMELGRWLRSKHTVIKLNDVLFAHGGLPPKAAERDVSLKEINKFTRETIDSRSYERVFIDELRKHYGHTDESLFWYRGYHRAEEGRYPQVTTGQLDSILDTYDVKTIVVGHTGVSRIESLYEGRVIGIDVPLKDLGSFQGFLWEDGEMFRVLGDGTKEALLDQ
jgi:hypothetical protein